jgi:rRNA biogenesis protein RRP5
VLHTLLSSPDSKAAARLRAGLPDGAIPDLTQLFSVGQYVRACVIHLSGGEDTPAGAANGAGRDGKKGRKVVECSLRLKKVVGGGGAGLLVEGQVVGACVRSVEDHGYTLSFGIKVGEPWVTQG